MGPVLLQTKFLMQATVDAQAPVGSAQSPNEAPLAQEASATLLDDEVPAGDHQVRVLQGSQPPAAV